MNNYQPRAPHPRRHAAEPRHTSRLGNVTQQAGGPRRTPDDGAERGDDRHRVASAQLAHLARELFPVLPDRFLRRFDQQLAVAVTADGPAEEVEPLGEVDYPRLVLVDGHSASGEPSFKPRLDLLGLLPGVAADGEIVGISDQNGGILLDPGLVVALVADSSGFLKAVQRDG